MTAIRDEAVDTVKSLAPTADEKAALGLLSDIANDVKLLAAQEVALAKTELTSEVSKVGKAAGMFAGAAFGALMVIVFLSTAAWWGLSNVVDQSWAALIVAGVWMLITAVLALLGRSTMTSVSLKPERTLQSIKRIPAAFQGR